MTKYLKISAKVLWQFLSYLCFSEQCSGLVRPGGLSSVQLSDTMIPFRAPAVEAGARF